MKLIADGGSTKVHWRLSDGNIPVADIFTPGMNPSVMPAATLRAILETDLIPQLPENIAVSSVEYYGAGCRGEACHTMRQALGAALPHAAEITVDSDMLGACVAMSRGIRSIVCILGTGANSCLFDGEKIIGNVPPLGYILGDEGSGAWLGKTLVADVLKGILPEAICREFHRRYPYGYDELIRRIYRPAEDDTPPNSFLATFAPFLSEHIDCPEIGRIVVTGFSLFFERNIMLYCRQEKPEVSHGTLPLYFTGSVAYAFRKQLEDVASRYSLPRPSVRRSPLE